MAANGGPDPLDPKYAPGAEQARQNVMIGVSAAMTLIGVTCVGLRVYTRAFIVRNMGTEDWTMIAAALLTIVFLLELIAGAKEFLMGFSGMSITTAQMVGNLKMILAIIVVYKMIMTLIKISILLIYLRIAVNKTFERLCKGTIGLLMAYQLIVVIVVPAQCRPLHKLWDFAGEVQGQCINANAFYHATSAFHITMDLWILVLPLKFIITIPRPPREKIALFVIFGLGVFSMIASIIRLQFLRLFTLSNDPFFDSLPINTWSMVDVNIGILCASIPTLRPLISKAQRSRTRQVLHSSGGKPTESKQGLLKTGRDLFISLQVSTQKSVRDSRFKLSDIKEYDEEYELDDKPPPVPPKDPNYAGSNYSASPTSIKMKYPEMVYHKI